MRSMRNTRSVIMRRSARWGYELNDHSGFCTSWGSMKSVRSGGVGRGGLVHLGTRTFHRRGGTHVVLAHQPSAMWVVRVEGYTDVRRRPDEASCGGSGEGSSNGSGSEDEGRGKDEGTGKGEPAGKHNERRVAATTEKLFANFLQKSIIPGVINLWNEITIYNMVV